MDYAIIGGDARMASLAEQLRRSGHRAQQLLTGGEDARAVMEAPDHIRGASGIVVNCPPRVRGTRMSLGDVLALAGREARIFLCGPKSPETVDKRITDLWADEALQRDNARLTAEGAVAAIMRAGSRSIGDMACAVIGWGRVGSALGELLVAMGARVVVASRTRAHRNRAIERGAEAVSLEALPEVLPGMDAVFSTPPSTVLNEEVLSRVNPEALIVDLASPPYGVDLHAAWALGLRAWREPGLPGRYCPESAGMALLRAIERAGGLQ